MLISSLDSPVLSHPGLLNTSPLHPIRCWAITSSMEDFIWWGDSPHWPKNSLNAWKFYLLPRKERRSCGGKKETLGWRFETSKIYALVGGTSKVKWHAYFCFFQFLFLIKCQNSRHKSGGEIWIKGLWIQVSQCSKHVWMIILEEVDRWLMNMM